MKKGWLVVLFFFLAASQSLAEDTDVFGVVKVNVKPNVMVLLDNSASMKRIEGPVGKYDPNIEYFGIYDKTRLYYRLAPIVKKIRPGIMRQGLISNIVCSSLKTDIDTKGESHSKFFKQADGKFHCSPQNTGSCDSGYEPDLCSVYLGNYLNWYFWGHYDEVYNKDATYYGNFTKNQVYLDRGRKLIDSPEPDQIEFEMDALSKIDDRNLLDALNDNGEWHSSVGKQLDRDNGKYKISISSELNFYSAYHGNYLNWFFYRSSNEPYNKSNDYKGCFEKRNFYYIADISDPVQKIKDDHNKGQDPISNSIINCQVIKDDLGINAASATPEATDPNQNAVGFWSGAVCLNDTIRDWKTVVTDIKCGPDSILNDLMDTLKIKYHAYSGNYLNWYYERRIDLAKRVICKYFKNTRTDARLGLMTFNDFFEASSGVLEDGGHVNYPVTDDINGFVNAVRLVKPISRLHSPLSETLAEAGLYFAGKTGWYSQGIVNSNPDVPPITDSSTGKYKSPITQYCQSNNVIIISDGVTPFDLDHRLWRSPATGNSYICDWDEDQRNDYIGDYNKHADLSFIDDVAAYLNKNDIYKDPESWETPNNEETTQNVRTHAIGFMIDGVLDNLTTNKGRLAYASQEAGGGIYSDANDAASLEAALSESIESVMNNILTVSSFFVTPSVPVSSNDQSFSGDFLYLSMFLPDKTGRWIGNIKKYPVNSSMTLGTEEWSGNTSVEVQDGGVRSKLKVKRQDERVILFNDGNKATLKPFNHQNVTLEKTKGNMASWDATKHAKLVDSVRWGGSKKDDGTLNDYALGDIIHFAPLFQRYEAANPVDSKVRIFAGSNDGMLHCFSDDLTNKEEYGKEIWAFIPEEQIARLKYLIPEGHQTSMVSSHSFYIDGGRTLYEKDGKKYLIFGERRGGKNYYALDVTSPDSPQFAYSVKPGNAYGESWTNPKVVQVMYGTDSLKDVFWIGGGYDSANQDLPTIAKPDDRPASTDSLGKGVCAVDASSGQIIITPPSTGIGNCILDPVSFNPGYDYSIEDTTAKPLLMKKANSRMYACDLGGNLWGFRDDVDYIETDGINTRYQPGQKDGSWTIGKIFKSDKQRKIFHRPEVVLEQFNEVVKENGKTVANNDYRGEYVFFGTGDREHPAAKPDGNTPEEQNRFYGIKNYWVPAATPAEESNLIDVTSLQEVDDNLKNFSNRGWYLRLENNGEKVVSHPVAYRGMVFFTTYTPSADTGSTDSSDITAGSDPCGGGNNLGIARLYALNYKTGGPVLNLNPKGIGSDGSEINDPADSPLPLCKSDRSVVIGTGMPGAPQLIFPSTGGSKIIAGVGNKIFTQDLNVRDMTVYYWKEKR